MEQAGATITVGTWPRALKVFKQNLEAGKFDESMKLSGGRKMKIDKVRFLYSEVMSWMQPCGLLND